MLVSLANSRQPRRQQAGKMLVPLLAILVVLSMGVAAVAIVLQMQEREKRQAKEQELYQSQSENDELKSKLQAMEQDKVRAEESLASTRKDLTQAQDELAKAVDAKETLSRSVEDREREIARLTKDLDQTRQEAKQAGKQLADLREERDTAKRQLADVEQAKQDLETKVMELTEKPTVELEKVLVTPDQVAGGGSAQPGAAPSVVMPASASTGPNAGQVVVVNREYDFIVMNLGKNHGLSVGQEFQIVRGTQVLGKVKVEKVYDELSAAAILPESQKNNIREGDAVRPL